MELCLLFLLCCCCCCARATLLRVGPDDSNVEWDGRWDRSDPAAPVMAWSNSGFRICFEGASAATVRIADTGDIVGWLRVFADGAEVYSGPNNDAKEGVRIAGLNASQKHTLRVAKRNEVSHCSNAFFAVDLEGPATPRTLPWPEPRTRSIEFIGDSITCGYGVLGANRSCRWSLDTLDVTYAYGELVATRFGAELFEECWSGIGIVRNYDEKNHTSAKPLPYYYKYTTTEARGALWDFSYKPDAIVLNLGTNDYSTDKQFWPSDETFITGMVTFVRGLLAETPTVQVFLACGASDLACNNVNKAASAIGAHAHYIHLPALNADTELGCDWHPNVKGQRKMADAVIPVVQEVMGW